MQQLASWIARQKRGRVDVKVGVARIFRALSAHFLVCGSSLLEVLDPPLNTHTFCTPYLHAQVTAGRNFL